MRNDQQERLYFGPTSEGSISSFLCEGNLAIKNLSITWMISRNSFRSYPMKAVLTILILMVSVCSCSRTFYSPQMCNDTKRVNDCSFQIPANGSSCQVYNTEVCNNNFDALFPYLQPMTELESTSDAPFDVSAVPYSTYVYQIQKSIRIPISAINITVSANHKDITGFSLNLTRVVRSANVTNICRIFDFRNSSGDLQFPMTFYYDCLHYLVEEQIQNVTLFVTVYPLNVKLSYLIFIPGVDAIGFNVPVCNWKPLVMILEGGLPQRVIELKFSNAPENLNVTYYIVTVLDAFDTVEHSVKITSSNDTFMISNKFKDIKNGFHYISISISTTEGLSCIVARTTMFHTGIEYTSETDIIFWSVMLSILVLIVGVSAHLLYLYKSHRDIHYTTDMATKIVFVYSYDYPEHEELVLDYKGHLEKCYKCAVDTIYKTGQDAYSWLVTKYAEADVIIFVISKGMHHVIDKGNNPPLEQKHPCRNRLQTAYNIYFSKFHKLSEKKVCAVSFPYSGEQHIPKLLKPVKFFKLPKEEFKLMCYVFGCSNSCCKKHRIISNAGKDLQHDEEFKKRLQVINEIVSKTPLLFEIKSDLSEIDFPRRKLDDHEANSFQMSTFNFEEECIKDWKQSNILDKNAEIMRPLMSKCLYESHERS